MLPHGGCSGRSCTDPYLVSNNCIVPFREAAEVGCIPQTRTPTHAPAQLRTTHSTRNRTLISVLSRCCSDTAKASHTRDALYTKARHGRFMQSPGPLEPVDDADGRQDTTRMIPCVPRSRLPTSSALPAHIPVTMPDLSLQHPRSCTKTTRALPHRWPRRHVGRLAKTRPVACRLITPAATGIVRSVRGAMHGRGSEREAESAAGRIFSRRVHPVG